MGNRWKRWREYMDELEEAMRMAGVELDAVERESARRNGRDTWRTPQQDAVAPQLVAKARDIPFFRELVGHAAALGEEVGAPAPEELSPWRTGVNERRQDSAQRAALPEAPESSAGQDSAAGAIERNAPARLRNAERALAHRTRSLIPVLEELVTPRNASAIVRSAEALGLQEIHFVDPRGKPRLNKSITRMCHRWMDLRWHRRPKELLHELRNRGYTLLAADFGSDSRPLHLLQVKGPIAVVLGSEQRGVSTTMRKAADGLFHLPSSGFTSYLNVSVMAGIALYELDRRLSAQGLRTPLPSSERDALRRAWYAILAGEDEARQREYAAWAESPPVPTPLVKPVPSREKSREEAD